MIIKVLPNPCNNILVVKQVNKSNWQPKQLLSEVAKNKLYVDATNYNCDQICKKVPFSHILYASE